MNILIEALPELLGALGSAAVVGAVVWGCRRWRRQNTAAPPTEPTNEKLTAAQTGTWVPQPVMIRRYTLLGTTANDGCPVQLMSTRPPGTLIIWPGRDRPERFELTGVRLYDGTFAAEPVDRYEPSP